MYRARLQKIRLSLREKNAQAILVTNAKNIFYLTGFIGISSTDRESVMLVTHANAYLFVPKMYEIKSRNLKLENHDVNLIVDHERHNLLTHFCEFVDATQPVLCEASNLTISEFNSIKEKTTIELRPENGLIEALRILKDETEIKKLNKAIRITENIFQDIINLLRRVDSVSELTELGIVDTMRMLGRTYDSNGFGFDPIVALGAHAAEPHYATQNNKLSMQNALLLDFGFTYEGYTADFSRTIFLGTADDEFRHIYESVRKVHDACVQAVAPGVTTKELYDLSVDLFTKEGLAHAYLHSLGHGLGLDVHEAPSVGCSKISRLEPGMVITIEPGLYIAEKFGVRIEDDILVTDTGSQTLTTSSKKLIEINNRTQTPR